MIEISKMLLQIRATPCEECGAIFHEIPEAEVDNCPHCGHSLFGQELEPKSVNTDYELRVDHKTRQPYLIHIQTGKRLNSV